ncbi:LysM domain-containing protein [Colletotrichum higginsianum]|uniref:LysM domain-containing protein n=1 Tax=Colletotrichum higginsianum TaxID=80884 RepID=A0A4T0W2J3_9PEZI|nr:LysM domain-containing protein [Colletotrichum higginsianum]
MTSSCGITGKPVTTTTIDYSTSEPEPTEASCGGTRYAIQSGDDCYSISKAQGTCVTIADAAGITETQLKAWNLVINSVCSNIDMMNGTTLCITPPEPQLTPPVTTNIPPLIPTTAAPAPTDAAGVSNKPCGRWYDVGAGDYCNLVVLKFAISLDDFLFLNTGINANCTNLYAGESYCVQPVGDINTYDGRPGYVSVTVDPSAAFTGVPFTMLPNATVTSYSRPYTPAPLATGVRDDCVHYFKGDDYQFPSDQLGDWKSNCELTARNYNADNDNFVAWNALGTNVTDPACSFVAGERYCGSWNLQATRTVTETDPATTTSGDGGSTPPAATHSGQPADFDTWHVVVSDDSCHSVADGAGISLDQFYDWNPAVSRDCSTNFWLGQAYCVGISGDVGGTGTTKPPTTTSAAPTTSKPSPPGPTHTSQPSNCNKWDIVESGDACGLLAESNGISLNQFLTWNPAVSSDCVANLWLGQAYCVGVSGSGTISTSSSTALTRTTTTSAVNPTPPAPTHEGQPSNCNKWNVVQSGDGCASMAQDNGISLNQFYDWNPAVSRDCVTNFWLGQAYCVGVSS